MKIERWICDVCELEIEKPDDGWIQWWVSPDYSTAQRLRLVHHKTASPYGGSCQDNEDSEMARQGFHEANRPLRHYLGIDGLMLALSDLADQTWPKEEALEMIRRLHIPGYEHARKHFEEAISAGIIERKDPPGYYSQTEIQVVLQFIGQ